MKVFLKKFSIPIFFIFIFIFIRTLYYRNLFVFIYDQASSSIKVLEIWKNRQFTLIGPPMSLKVENRQIFFGGISYYIQLCFQLIGNFDPFWSTYAFMVFSALMIFPLYEGIKKLINKKCAVTILILYSLLPFFIESTYSLWNPNFMFALMPLLLFFMSKFKNNHSYWFFLIFSLLNGVLFQLHYTYIFTFIGLGIYYFFIKKLSFKYFILYCLGFVIGTSNLIIFELRHNFYLLQTLLIFISHPKNVSQHWFADYYALSQIFFFFIIVAYILRKKITTKLNILLFITLLLITIPYVTIYAKGRNRPKNWFYKDELYVYKIIKKKFSSVNDFNIFEFYDATANTQKYFLKRDGLQINYEDYYHNKYLYVIYHNDQYMKDPAYEVASFKPNRIIQKWNINNYYIMILLERLNR